jgi:hypothetical protein
MTRITDDTVLVAVRDQVSCDLQGEAAILNLATGIYYGLDQVGASVWQQLQTPARVVDVCDQLVATYAVDRTTAHADLLELLAQLLDEGLVEFLPQRSM